MGEKKQTPPLPPKSNGEFNAYLELFVHRFLVFSMAGSCGALFCRSPVTRWASVAFGAGAGIGSAFTECYGSSVKFANPKISDTPPPDEQE